MSIDILRDHCGKPEKVRISRVFPPDSFLYGYVLGLTDELCMLHAFDDFHPDGYTIVRIRDISSVRRDKYEVFWDGMLQKEGLLDGLSLGRTIDLSSMEAAINSVQSHYGRMIIECEHVHDDNEDFYLGSVVRMEDGRVVFDNFDACGRWEESPDVFDTDEITKLQFETDYISRFWKYAIGDPPQAIPVRNK